MANELAYNIALRNKRKETDVYNLNYAVQNIIDRIIFLRIAEDRQMEDYGMLRKAGQGSNIYKTLINIFHQANDKYNSGLFAIDEWVDNLDIDDKVFEDMISNLYSPPPTSL